MSSECLNFSVVTPSLNMLPYLKRCCASVADQQRVTVEHTIVDAESNDGTVAWLKENNYVNKLIEPDEGMYDAINKGWKISNGEFLSYLNCDEQYLPDTLSFVKQYFEFHPDVDVVFGDAVLVNSDGSFLAYRKGYPPRMSYIAVSHLYLLTCTMFLRRRVVEDGHFFNTDFKIIGDYEFVLRLLRAGLRLAHCKRYMSVFTLTGQNLSYNEKAKQEKKQLDVSLSSPLKLFRYPLNGLRLLEKAIYGAYWQKMPFKYSIYTTRNIFERTEYTIIETKNAWRWPDSQN